MRLEGIVKRYGDKTVLAIDALSFEPGRIYAIIGANGCGKSTLVRIAAGVLAPDAGSVDRAGEQVGFMPQRSYAFYGTLRRNLMLGAHGELPRGAAAGSARDAWAARADELMAALDLTRLADDAAKRLSGGETARMALARVLMARYDLLVLDEPTAALDIRSTLAAEELLRAYRDEQGAGIVVVTHFIKQARRIADEVLFLHEGRLLEHGDTAKVLSRPCRTPELQRFLDLA